MNNGFDARQAASELKRFQDAAVEEATIQFLDRVVGEAYKRGRDMEFRTAQEHKEGMRKLGYLPPAVNVDEEGG